MQVERETTTKTYSVTSQVAPHSVIITRSSTVARGGAESKSKSSRVGAAPDIDFNEGDYSLVTAKGVSEVKTTRDQEKKDLQDLNDRFATYLDKVRLLEAQNRKLADELEKLKAKWGKETAQIKAMYQAELDDARRELDRAEKEKARLEIKVASLEEQITEIQFKISIVQSEIAMYREKLDQQNNLIIEYENEIQMLRKQLESLEKEREKDKKTIGQLEDMVQQTREQLDEATLNHIDSENRRQTLEEEIEFLKSVHDQEMKELGALAYKGSSPENRDYWRNQLLQAIREIEEMYGEKMDDAKRDMEASYNFKLQEFRTAAARQGTETVKSKEDTKDLRQAVGDLRDRINDLDARNNQLLREIEALKREKEDRERQLEADNAKLRDDQSDVRAQLEAVMKELQNLLGSKMTLDLEIAAYRKLLEGEERRTNTKIDPSSRDRDRHAVAPPTDEEKGSSAKGEMSAKTTYSRTAKGSIAVADCPPDGRCVRIENTGKKEENIAGFKIVRNVDNHIQPAYVLDERFQAFPAGLKTTLWAKGYMPPTAPKGDIEIEEPTWGIGSTVVTTLINAEGEDRASLTQKTTYA